MTIAQRYVSKELTHFVGRELEEDEDRYRLLVKIISQGCLTYSPGKEDEEAHLKIKNEASLSANEMYRPDVVCFCDIPLMDFTIHMMKYSSFGLSFQKKFLADNGAAPLFYIPREAKIKISNQVFSKAKYFDIMVKEYRELFEMLMEIHYVNKLKAENVKNFIDFHILSYIKFFTLDISDDDWENYYMEREWRMFGRLEFTMDDIWRVILPSSYGSRFRRDVPGYSGQLVYVD